MSTREFGITGLYGLLRQAQDCAQHQAGQGGRAGSGVRHPHGQE